MRRVVLYKSKSGFVKTYAQWIAEELSADLFEASEISLNTIMSYDVIIYGGGLYASGINGVKLITNNLHKLKGKKVIVYASGAAPPRREVVTEVFKQNFTNEQGKHIIFFYLRGGFDYSRLNSFDKILMNLLKWKILLKKKIRISLNGDEIGMLGAFDKPMDFTDKKHIVGLLEHAKGSIL